MTARKAHHDTGNETALPPGACSASGHSVTVTVLLGRPGRGANSRTVAIAVTPASGCLRRRRRRAVYNPAWTSLRSVLLRVSRASESGQRRPGPAFSHRNHWHDGSDSEGSSYYIIIICRKQPGISTQLGKFAAARPGRGPGPSASLTVVPIYVPRALPGGPGHGDAECLRPGVRPGVRWLLSETVTGPGPCASGAVAGARMQSESPWRAGFCHFTVQRLLLKDDSGFSRIESSSRAPRSLSGHPVRPGLAGDGGRTRRDLFELGSNRRKAVK